MKKFILMLIFIVLVAKVNAQSQSIKIDIDHNFIPHINQSLPFDTDNYNSFKIKEIKGLSSRLVDYIFKNISSDENIATFTYENDIISINYDRLAGIKDISLYFESRPSFNTDFFVSYDFAVYNDLEFLKSPYFEISYPKELILIETYPKSSEKDPIKIDYPENPNLGPISIYFIKKEIPLEYEKEEYNQFKIIGKKELAKKVLNPTKNLNFIPELFKDLTGNYPLDNIWIFIINLSGGKYSELGGESHEPNIILLDEEWISQKSISYIQIQKTIIHEIMHLVNNRLFNHEQKYTPWLDEGLPTFAEIYAVKNYMDLDDCWIEKHDNETFIYKNENKFTKEELLERYNQSFYFSDPTNESELRDFYRHAGLVFYNLYISLGKEKFHELYRTLESLKSSGDNCEMCDTNKVLDIIKQISNKSEQEILFPYKGSIEFDEKIKPLIRNDCTQKEIKQIFNKTINPLWFMIMFAIIASIMILIKFILIKNKNS